VSSVVVMVCFVNISQVIGWEGWVFCTSQEIGWDGWAWFSWGHFGDDVSQVWWPSQQCQSIEGGWLVIQTGGPQSNQAHSVTIIQHACRYNTRK